MARIPPQARRLHQSACPRRVSWLRLRHSGFEPQKAIKSKYALPKNVEVIMQNALYASRRLKPRRNAVSVSEIPVTL